MFLSGKVIDVDTGDIQVSSSPVLLQSIALGSCIGLIMYEANLRIGGLAHIMLPGKSPKEADSKYAEDAVEALADSMEFLGAKRKNLQISIVGGANILRDGDLPDKLIDSVVSSLKNSELNLIHMRVGGFERRSVILNTASGEIFFTEGDDNTKLTLEEFTKL